MIKADIKRIFTSKGFLIWLAIWLGYSLFNFMSVNSAVNSGHIANFVAVQNFGFTEVNGSVMPLFQMSDPLTVVVFLTPLILTVISIDFSSGTIKNTLSVGVPRLRYFGVKLILVWIISFILHLFDVFGGTVLLTLTQGFGADFTFEWLISILQPFLLQSFILLSIMSVGVCFAFMIKKTAGVLGAFIALTAAPPMIFMMFNFWQIGNLEWLSQFELTTRLLASAHFSSLSSGDVFQIVMVGVGWQVISIWVSMVLFKKAEIK